MEEITKAYLIDISTTFIKGQYRTRGTYRFGSNFLFADLISLNGVANPALVGDIADVFYVCHLRSDDPFELYFEVLLNSPMIRPDITIEKLTQAQAFEQFIRNRYQQLSESSSFCDDVFSKADSLGINKIMSNYEEEKIKRMHQYISSQYIPCSSFVLNIMGDYVKRPHFFSEPEEDFGLVDMD